MSSTVSVAWDPVQTFKEMVSTGFRKAHLPLSSMVTGGIMAGLFLSFGVNTMVNILDGCGGTGPCRFLAGFGFSSGLFFILCMGSELFTGNCLIFLAVLSRRLYWYEMVKDWIVIWFSNLIGSMLTEVMLFAGGNFGGAADPSATGQIYCSIAAKKSGLPAHEIFFRAISANILVCLGVLIFSAAKSMEGKFVGVSIPISAFIASGFEHSIANMCIFSMATLLDCHGAEQQGKYWLNLVLATLGNTVGACILCLSAWVTFIRHSDIQLKEVPHGSAQSDKQLLPPSVASPVLGPKKTAAPEAVDAQPVPSPAADPTAPTDPDRFDV